MELRLKDISPWKNDEVFGRFMLIVDNDSFSGDFMFSAMLLKFLGETDSRGIDVSNDNSNASVTVHVLCANHPRHHYEYIMKKHNMNLDTLEANGRVHFSFYDASLADLNVSLNVDTIMESEIVSQEGLTYSVISLEGERSTDDRQSSLVPPCSTFVEDFLKGLRASMESFDPSSKVVIMIDNLDILDVCLGCETSAGLMGTCHDILFTLQNRCAVVAFGSTSTEFIGTNDDLSSDSSTHSSTLERCKYRADVSVQVSPLSSGYSSEVHGLLQVSFGLDSVKYFYKASGDTLASIKCFASNSGSKLG